MKFGIDFTCRSLCGNSTIQGSGTAFLLILVQETNYIIEIYNIYRLCLVEGSMVLGDSRVSNLRLISGIRYQLQHSQVKFTNPVSFSSSFLELESHHLQTDASHVKSVKEVHHAPHVHMVLMGEGQKCLGSWFCQNPNVTRVRR